MMFVTLSWLLQTETETETETETVSDRNKNRDWVTGG